VNIPVLVASAVTGRWLVPESRDPDALRLDPVGAILSIGGLGALVWALIEAPDRGWTSSGILTGFALSAVVLTAFVAWELRSDHPMLDLRIFANARFSAASGAITAAMFGMFGSIFLLAQFLQFVLGYSALEAGARMLPVALAMFVAAPSSARLVERFGTKRVVASGLGLASVGLAMVATFSPTTGFGPVALSMMVMGFGMGLTMAPATESIMGSLPPAKAGVGSAVNDTTREIGGALGVAIIGSMLSSVYAGRVADALAGTPLPSQAVDAATGSLGGALAVANGIGGSTGAALAATARSAFTDGMARGVLVGAATVLLGAVVAWKALPARATAHATEHDVAELPDEPAGFEGATA
jgi:EmrB/QacA subfamily drug resistance transporter